jgi:tRNA/tmRNA/rRNA uracil-C5-methylase (TrmA/RlmC/RlmD family)
VKTEGDTHLSGMIAGQHPAGPFLHDTATFTQSSFWGNEALLTAAREMLDQIKGPLETCIELFCGAGHFSFELLDRFNDLLCIEGDPRAYFWLAENRGKHPKQDQMEIWQTQVDGNRIDLLPDICPIDLLFMDPPRDGVRQITQIIEALKPQNIILVACDLANGARDLGLLCQHGYKLQRLQPLDIFAHNHHLEWIAQLERSPEDESC